MSMKTSLTQAWEAKGFTGYALREKVNFELANKFHKENPDWEKYWGRVMGSAFGMLVVFGLFAVCLQLVAPILPTDLSQSVALVQITLLLVFPSISAVIFSSVFYSELIKNFRKAVKCQSISRYVFQHRDDEVEL